MEDALNKILVLWRTTREYRLECLRNELGKSAKNGRGIDAAACAIREAALLDAAEIVGLSKAERRLTEKI